MIGVIGCGNMAQAIVKGFYQKNDKSSFLTYTPTFTRANELAQAVNGRAVKNLGELNQAQTLVIACKPQQLNDLAEKIKSEGLDLTNKHCISLLAAVSIRSLQEKLAAPKITRVMPNTPALIGKGVSLIIHSNEVAADDKKLVTEFFAACGEVFVMPDEKTFNQVTTVSGSGPAYVYLFAKTMSDQLMAWGLDEAQAKKIVIQLFRGSSELMNEQSEFSLDELIGKVTSKGGVTIEAVKSYQNDGINQLTVKALAAAFKRSEEIQGELK